MRLPSLSVIIVSQLVVWCVVGALVHGGAILLYPLAWLTVGLLFFIHNKYNPIQPAGSSAPQEQRWANSRTNSAAVTTPQADESEPQKLATAD